MAFCELGILQERTGGADLPAGGARQHPWPHPAPPSRPSRCLRPAGAGSGGRTVGHRGPPGFAGQPSASSPASSALPSPGVAVEGRGRGVSGTRSAAPRFVGLVLLPPAKRQSEEGKGLQSSDVVRRCPWTPFTIVISGGIGAGESICECPKRAIGFHVHEDISFRKGGTICP